MYSTTNCVILIAFISMFMWACESNPDVTGANYSKSVTRTILSDTCRTVFYDSRRDTIAYQINENCARSFIDKYDAYIDGVNTTLKDHHLALYPNSSEKLVYGAYVNLHELRRVLLWADTHSGTDSLYIMLGIMPTDSTEAIFALQTTSVTNEDTWRYFDFTRPCPTACPKWD